MEKDKQKENIVNRPPVVVVMGHIDHGKSTLLDYIRKTTVTEKEAGGITQRISAYEVTHQNSKITFIDTPGHEAFSKMRERGAKIADIAILVVSAEDGVKPQTIEAWKTIVESDTPCIVAINKIDKVGADIEKTKKELAEHEIYLESYGGKIPSVDISAKVGTGVDELLSLILILAEMENFTGDSSLDASGYVIEVNLDSKRGIMATLIIKNGTIKNGMTVVIRDAMCSTRIIENFLGKAISKATFSSPIRIVGFDKMPRVGAQFKTFQKKGDAVAYIEKRPPRPSGTPPSQGGENVVNKKIIPIILKADGSGSIEAIEKEISKINSDTSTTINKNAEFRIVGKGIGPISESDIKNASSGDTIVIGFNVKADKSAIDTAQKRDITISFFNIIYQMTKWLEIQMEERRPKIETIETTGRAKIIRAFSRTKERQILGGKVTEGQIGLNSAIRIMRRGFEIGRAKIVNLEKNKVKTSEISEGSEFGMMIESKIEVVAGDILESFSITQK
ncbi:MAG: translation initiation factor IF-2 [Candidatus Pacebacteria bacterium]|nr:translation initiation factor IF-2 [Candidatus Paceibacterota bacterium]